MNQLTVSISDASKKPNIGQFIISHKEFKEAFEVEYERQKDDTPLSGCMALCCTIGQALFNAADKETQQRLRKELSDKHDALIEAVDNASNEQLPPLSQDDSKQCVNYSISILLSNDQHG